jgi:hypothetical protein
MDTERTMPERREVSARYDEYAVGSTTIVMVTDPTNSHAWIQSDLTVDIER